MTITAQRFLLIVAAIMLFTLAVLITLSQHHSQILGTISTTTASTTPESTLYACDGDGKVCPDGTIVGRTGPLCQFTECPGVIPVGTTTR